MDKLNNYPKDKYVYRGSDKLLDKLEPEQSFYYYEKRGQWRPDGRPAVFATDHPDQAVKEALKEDSRRTSYVYVLDKSQFTKKDDKYRSENSVKPVAVVKVT